MSCKELFDLFKTIGEKLECNYTTKKCTLSERHNITVSYPKNLSCDIKPESIGNLEDLISEIGFKPYVKLYNIPDKSYDVPLGRLHAYHIKNTNGIVIEINNKDKEWYQKRTELL
jgi:hypothetical protein